MKRKCFHLWLVTNTATGLTTLRLKFAGKLCGQFYYQSVSAPQCQSQLPKEVSQLVVMQKAAGKHSTSLNMEVN